MKIYKRKMNLNKIYIFLFFTQMSLFVFSSVEQDLQKANEYYQQKNYVASKNILLKLISEKHENASIYYNLGNCYYHLQEYPKSILYLEKAKKNAPADKSIEHNLMLANKNGLKKNEYDSQFFLFQWANQFFISKNTTTWSMLFLIIFWLFAIFGTVYFFTRKLIFRTTTLIAFLFSLFLFFLTYKRYQLETNSAFAIVMQDAVLINKPSHNAKNIASIESGNKVKLLDKDGNYYKVKNTKGIIAWIDKKYISKI
jgi:tetratricopeptide (TPR) repeat protein